MRRRPHLTRRDGALGARAHADRDSHQGIGGEVAAGGEDRKGMWSMGRVWGEGVAPLWISSSRSLSHADQGMTRTIAWLFAQRGKHSPALHHTRRQEEVVSS